MIEYDTLYIDGKWVTPSGQDRRIVIDPATELPIGEVLDGDATDVDRAVAAAVRAQEPWAGTPVGERADLLRAVAAALRARSDWLLDLLIREVGTPRGLAEVMQFAAAVQVFDDAADLIGQVTAPEPLGSALVTAEPIGVAGLITPWNYPLYQAALKVAPALAAGCAVVLKPSELAPLSAFTMAEVIDEAGVPPGVFNLVPGVGAVAGEALAGHPDLDMVSFTGSVRAGQRIAALAAGSVTKVALELGGKGASIVVDGGDLTAAAQHAAASCFGNAGQTCAAMTRLVVPRDRLAEAESAVLEAAAPYVPGDPLSPRTKLGPLISAEQRARVRQHIAAGIAEGADLLVGGVETDLPPAGFYLPATVFSAVRPQMTIAQEEIFGPVLSIIPVDSEREAVAVANGTRYGLTAAVWGEPQRARRIGAKLRTGSVIVNGARINPSAPFGGRKQSGYGRERGRFGLEEYLTSKVYHL
ncbi:aldehyde dehydrogenase family protein [Phytohabitans kaempferiae]|uniref:aldehyde dehydrogenase (NAD(+)) n=1 Tax=Phytohabitans kaempferiae TaxID=1620943 RepID=A0ABV6MAJ6_9ACTN